MAGWLTKLAQTLPRLAREEAKTPGRMGEAAALLTGRGPSRIVRSSASDGGSQISAGALERLRRERLKTPGESVLVHTHPSIEAPFPSVSEQDLELWENWQSSAPQSLGMGVVQFAESPLWTMWRRAKPPPKEVRDMLRLRDLTVGQLKGLDGQFEEFRRVTPQHAGAGHDTLSSMLGMLRMKDKGLLEADYSLSPELVELFSRLAKEYPQAKARGGLVCFCK